MMRYCLLLMLSYVWQPAFTQQPVVKVHFLYGSKPEKAYEIVEKKWFGGIYGGHVGISVDDSIISFVPLGKLHYFARRDSLHSRFISSSIKDFKGIFDGATDAAVRHVCVEIPITDEQYQTLQLVTYRYLNQTPYDYAFIGMRCASATYDMLSQAGIMKPLKKSRMVTKIFYPKKLRKRIWGLAKEKNYRIAFEEGRDTRIWEKD